jgi:hypothetical protein
VYFLGDWHASRSDLLNLKRLNQEIIYNYDRGIPISTTSRKPATPVLQGIRVYFPSKLGHPGNQARWGDLAKRSDQWESSVSGVRSV